jgi:phosphoribosylformylglycinamidine (FGAM) synthase-like enzyme
MILTSSEYLYSYCGVKNSPAPYFNLEDELVLQKTISELIDNQLLQSCHDVSDGGLWITLKESGEKHGFTFDLNFPENIRKDAFLFGEGQGRVVVSISPEMKIDLQKICSENGVDCWPLGEVMV